MAKQYEFKPLQDMINAFFPIVMKDKDIIKFLQDSELDEEDAKTVATYLTACAAGMYLSALDREKFEKDIAAAQHIAAKCIEELSERCDQDVNEILMDVLKENIEEWFEIMSEILQKHHMENKEDEDPSSPDITPKSIIGVYAKVLFPILLREEDVTEFLEEYEEDARNEILGFICGIVLMNYAAYVDKNRDQYDENNPLIQQMSNVGKELENQVSQYIDHFKECLEDFDEFNEKVKEIISDHLNEFIKKMIKSINKLVSNNQ